MTKDIPEARITFANALRRVMTKPEVIRLKASLKLALDEPTWHVSLSYIYIYIYEASYIYIYI